MLQRLSLSSGLVLAVMLSACGTPSGSDAGVDSGAPFDAGFDAGPPAVCLVDKLDAGPDDAGWDGGYDFSCRGVTRSPGGQGELIITGKTTRAGLTRTGLGGITVDLLGPDGTVLATTISSPDGGAYRLTFDAGCQPLDGRVRATSSDADAGFAVAFAVPDAPWQYDRSNLELVMFDPSTQGLAAAFAGVTLVDGASALAMTVEDCAGNDVEGAVVDIGDAGDVRYVGTSGLPSNMLSATGASGDLVIFNVPADVPSVTVTARRNGQIIGQRVVPVQARTVTGTFLSP